MRANWIVLGLCTILLTGCWDRTEINDLAIITAASIDMEGKNKVLLSVQVFIPRALGGSGAGGGSVGGGEGKLTMMRSSEGINIADAMSKLQTKIPRKIFWGHCKVYLFGEEAAKHGLADHIDFLVRHPEPRNRSFLYVSKGKGLDMLTITPALERSTAESLREYANLHIAMAVTLVDYRNMLRSEAEAVAIPMIEDGKNLKSPEDIQIRGIMAGTAILKRDKLIGKVSPTATRGLLWLRDEMQKAAITVRIKDEKGIVSVSPTRTKTTLLPKIENGKWSMLVKVDSEGDVVENGTQLNLMNPKYVAMLQTSVQKDIDERMKMALDVLQHELRTDVVKFAAAFHRKYPKEWEQAKDRWDEIFSQLEVKTDVRVAIRRPGLISAPAGIPQEEVKTE
ncbi:Ger(x)C family spore germination protein [Brevibacillus choshinensis]|uniref:Ger(X)C family spore germination protein n=1 Tax=Brevibacillus choshinensis TaxID=54911 RepID=A0ABX7FJB2_BRECH|nr:Ger(x)C family spore germination protein [Brevibacillus choshinensis]QRG65080.1 Ger(x)C family spore germination protein [Brevibacillus choshinensis]